MLYMELKHQPGFTGVMDSKLSSSSVNSPHQEPSNHDELFLHQSLLFSATLKDLKNLRKQLYSAADYFELSYSKEDQQKQLVVETLKDYAIKALINTVDHLGSVAYKVDSLLDKKIGETSEMQLRFSCIEQKLQTCQGYVSQGGLSQQSLAMNTPKHHKRYIIPVDDETMDAIGHSKSDFNSGSFSAEYNLLEFKNAVQSTIEWAPFSSVFREHHSTIQSPQFYSRQGTYPFARTSTNKKPEKTAVFPQRFQLMRSGSLLKKPSLNYANAKRRCPSEPRRSVSLSMYTERNKAKDNEQYTDKNKRLFKALLSMRKSRKEGSSYKYLDDI